MGPADPGSAGSECVCVGGGGGCLSVAALARKQRDEAGADGFLTPLLFYVL